MPQDVLRVGKLLHLILYFWFKRCFSRYHQVIDVFVVGTTQNVAVYLANNEGDDKDDDKVTADDHGDQDEQDLHGDHDGHDDCTTTGMSQKGTSTTSTAITIATATAMAETTRTLDRDLYLRRRGARVF